MKNFEKHSKNYADCINFINEQFFIDFVFFIAPESVARGKKNIPYCAAIVALPTHNSENCQASYQFQMVQLLKHPCAIPMTWVCFPDWIFFHSVSCASFKEIKFEIFWNIKRWKIPKNFYVNYRYLFDFKIALLYIGLYLLKIRRLTGKNISFCAMIVAFQTHYCEN